MEALIFILNALAVAAAVVMSLLDERRKPGNPPTSIFRYTENRATAKIRMADSARQSRLDKSVI